MKQLQHVAVTAKGAPASAPFFAILADDVTGFVRAKAPSWRELAPKATEGVKCQSIVSTVSLCAFEQWIVLLPSFADANATSLL